MYFLKKSIRIISLSSNQSWATLLPFIVNSVNESVLEYGATPVQLMFGTSNSRSIDLLTFKKDFSDVPEYISQLEKFIEEARKIHRKRKIQRIHHNLNYINSKRNTKNFKPGDLVLVQDINLVGQRNARTLYFPGTLLEVNKSENSALIQTFHTRRVIKSNFTFVRKLIKPLFIQLPEEWQKLVKDSLRQAGNEETHFDSQGESDDSIVGLSQDSS